MDIKAKEYIRTYDGIIGKILEDDDICQKGVIIDDSFLDDYCEVTDFVRYEDIKSYNFDISELLEEGDIVEYTVNKLTTPKVARVKKYKEARTLKEYLGVEGYKLEQIKIIRVLTREQFEDAGYEV